MEEILKELVQEQKKTNELLLQETNKSITMLTVKDIVAKYEIPPDTVYKIFKDPKLAVQTYTRPQTVSQEEFEKYLSVRHDYLSNK